MKKLILLLTLVTSVFAASAQSSLTGISPNSGTKGQTLNVTITGANTHFAQVSSSVVFFKNASSTTDIVLNSFSAASNTSIIANITVSPTAAGGFYDLAVYNPLDGPMPLYAAFNIPTTAKTFSISPPYGARGQTLNVSITGSNTNFTSGSATVGFFGQASTVIVNSVTPLSATSMVASVTVPVGATAGSHSVYVYDNADGMLNLPNAFVVTGGNIASVSPSSTFKGQTLNVQITGTGTNFTQGSSVVSFFAAGSSTTNLIVNSVTVNSNTMLTANITAQPWAPAGFYNVSVAHPINGLMTLNNAFRVKQGNIVANPDNATIGTTLDVNITGTGTHFMSSSSTLSFMQSGSSTSDISINNYVITSETAMKANINVEPWAAGGAYELVVENSTDGFMATPFNIAQGIPALIAVNPGGANANQSLNITITGSHTHFIQASSTNQLRFVQQRGVASPDITVNSISPVSETQLSVNVTIQTVTGVQYYDLEFYNSIDDSLFRTFAFMVNPVGLIEPEEKQWVRAYPNPSSGLVSFDLTLSNTNPVQLEVFDLLGSKVHRQAYEPSGPGTNTFSLNCHDAGIKTGIYFMNLKQGAKEYRTKIFIKRD